MSTNSIPFPTAINPPKPGHVSRPGIEPHLDIPTGTDLVHELTQMPSRSFDDQYDLDHIKYLGRSITQYLQLLGHYLNTPLDGSAGEVFSSEYEPRDVTPPSSSANANDASGLHTDQVISVLDRQSAPQNRAVNRDTAPPQTTTRTDQAQQSRHGWRELGDFFVSFGFEVDEIGKKRFQTRVHHSQADQSAQWSGLAIGQLLAWMLRQTNLLSPPEDTFVPPDRVKALPAPVMTSGPIESQIINPSPQKSNQPLSIQPLPDKPQPIQCWRVQSSSTCFVNFLMILYAVVRLKKGRI